MHDVGEEEKLQMLYGHSERLAIAYSLLESSGETPIRVTKNLQFVVIVILSASLFQNA